jgi:hypothetical protein
MPSNHAMKQAGIVCLLLLLITACQRELGDGAENDPPPPTNCQLSKIVYYDSAGSVVDTAGFTYTNNKITRVGTVDYSMALVYTNDRVTRINYFNEANVQHDFYDSVAYNSEGKIESLTFLTLLSPGMPSESGGYKISYNADGTPAKVIERAESGGTVVDSYEYVYSWDNQNIVSMTVRDLENATNEAPLSFTYDSNPNYYQQFPTEFIFADNLLFGISGLRFGYFSPFLFSKNNIVSINGTPVAYSKDNNGNLSSFTVGSYRPAGYEYKCQ